MTVKPYQYVASCVDSTYEDIRDMLDNHPVVQVSHETMRKVCDLGSWARDMGYDRHLPLRKDWAVGYYRSVYRGVPCYFVRHSGVEHIFTLDGRVGPSLAE